MNSLDPCTSTIACLSWNACKKGCLLENNERRDFVSGDPRIDWTQYSMSFCPIQSQYEEHMGEGYGWQAREGKFLYGEGLRLKWEQLLTIESLIIPSKISLPFVSWGLNEKKLNWIELSGVEVKNFNSRREKQTLSHGHLKWGFSYHGNSRPHPKHVSSTKTWFERLSSENVFSSNIPNEGYGDIYGRIIQRQCLIKSWYTLGRALTQSQ